MPERPTDKELMKNVAELLDQFRGAFIDHLEPVGLTTNSRLLRLFDVWRQVSLRRIVDLAEAANKMFEQGRLVPGCTLTRAVFETVGIQYYVHKKMVGYAKESDSESVRNLLFAAAFGRKDMPQSETPIQVLTALDHLEQEFPRSRSEYDHLCEYAHPNLKGGFGTYLRQEGEKLESYFGSNPQKLEMGTWGLGSLYMILIIGAEIQKRLSAFQPESND